MDAGQFILILLISGLISDVIPQSILQVLPKNLIPSHLDLFSNDRKILRDEDNLFCDSWKFSVETNDAGLWKVIPPRCMRFVEDYMTRDRYASDSEQVAEDSLSFAKTVEISRNDGKDVWIFDIDETLLSNLPYYAIHGYGSEVFDESAFDEWVDLAECPAIPASLRLYKELQQLSFKLILLTGRDESQRNVTEKNLLFAGYQDWDKLFLRDPSDIGKTAVKYKSEKRMQLEAEGYRIHGNSGDQWSDLFGIPIATRSFKLPNPMYYVA